MEHQAKIDSFMEAVTNTFIGFIISFAVSLTSYWWYALAVPILTNLKITLIFTLVSVLRSYILRRAFNGKSVWAAITGR